MTLSVLRRWLRQSARPTRPFRRPSALRLEPLEDRTTPAFWTSNLVFNGTAAPVAGALQLTPTTSDVADPADFVRGSVFAAGAVDVTRFHTRFTFTLAPRPQPVMADGITITFQNEGPTALGGPGGGLGYGPDPDGLGGADAIEDSVALKFDIWDDAGEGDNSVGIYTGGDAPTVPSLDLTPAGIDLHSGHVFLVDLAYNGFDLSVTIQDTATGRAVGGAYAIDIPAAVGGDTAYVGFTGGGGANSTTQSVLSWDFLAWNALPSPIIWTGGGTSGGWSDPANWDLDRAPADGDSLIFPAGVADTITVNDLTGLDPYALDIQGDGYSLTGNPIVAVGGFGSGGVGVVYDLDTTLAPSTAVAGGISVFDVSGGSLTLGGTVAVGGGGVGFTVAPGASVVAGTGGGIEVGPGGLLSVLGSLDVQPGGWVALGGSGGIGAAGVVGPDGTFTNGGDLGVQNGTTFTVDGSYVETGSSLTVGDTSTFRVGPAGTGEIHHLTLVESGTLDVQGSVTIPAGGTVAVTGHARIVVAPGGTFTNLGTRLDWPQPAYTAGTPLGAAQLNATANVPGTFAYTLADGVTPADGAVLPAGPSQVIRVTFTPDDPAYAPVSSYLTLGPTTTGIADVVVDEDAADTVLDLPALLGANGSAGLTYTVQSVTQSLFGSGQASAAGYVGPLASATIEAATGLLTLDYAAEAYGTATVTVRATDPGGLYVEETFAVTVRSVNDAPTVWVLPLAPVAPDAGPVTVPVGPFWGSAAGAEYLPATTVGVQPYVYTQWLAAVEILSVGNPGLFAVQPTLSKTDHIIVHNTDPVVVVSRITMFHLAFTPAGFGGTSAVTFRVQDNEGAWSDPQTVNVVVNPATPAVAVTAAGGTYTGRPFVATAAVAGAGGVFGPSLGGVIPTVTYYAGAGVGGTPLPAAPTNAGTYTAVATFAGSPGYNAVTSEPATFAIAPAPLTVTATDVAKVYGQANPTFTASYAGFVGGDGPGVLGGALTFTTAATAGSPPGTYAVTPGGLTAANYAISFVPGTLTVRPVRSGVVVVGADAGGGPHVQAFDADGTLRFGLLAYDPGFGGGVRVATGDVTGDGVADIVTAAGPGGGPHVKVFDGVDLREVAAFFPYDPLFRGGVYVAVGDIDGDGRADVITGTDAGGGPHVKAFSGRDGSELASFFAYDPAFPGGVRVAAGDVDRDGRADIVTAAGPGGGPHVKAFSGRDGTLLRSFLAYDAGFAGGVYVAAGDFDGDGYDDVLTGAGAGGGSHVKTFGGADGSELASFFAYAPAFASGVRVGTVDLNRDGVAEVVTGAGPGGGPHVKVFDPAGLVESAGFFAYADTFPGGVYVA